MNALDKGRGISILVPFRSDGTERHEIFSWLTAFYMHHLPEAQFVVGSDEGYPFSKTSAVNQAARAASGDVYVVLDADCLIDPKIIVEAAQNIRIARANDKRRWYVPYRYLWRLTREASAEVLELSPASDLRYDEFDSEEDVENCDESGVGHNFGALIQIMPREAFELVGGMEERCRGWGVDDVAFMMALDTLYTRHRTMDEDVFTLFHTPTGRRHHRRWEGQDDEDPNGRLGERYSRANGDVERMRELVDEGFLTDPDA